MNIDFYITKKRGVITASHSDKQWCKEECVTTCGFLALCWHLWKWYHRVKVQARKAHKLRLEDPDMYVFRTRQIFRIETEN